MHVMLLEALIHRLFKFMPSYLIIVTSSIKAAVTLYYNNNLLVVSLSPIFLSPVGLSERAFAKAYRVMSVFTFKIHVSLLYAG